MESLCSALASVLLLDFVAELLRPFQRLRLQSFVNRLSQFFSRQVFVRNGIGTRPSSGYHSAPKRLITEKGNNNSRSASSNASSCCSSTAVMHNSRHTLEQPVVRTIAKH